VDIPSILVAFGGVPYSHHSMMRPNAHTFMRLCAPECHAAGLVS
jgi:hypothetical protein